MNDITPIELPAFMLGSNGLRLQVPVDGLAVEIEGMDALRAAMLDTSTAVLVSSANEHLLKDLRWSYLLSHEVRALYQAFDLSEAHGDPVRCALRMEIASSRKYTRIRVPNCRALCDEIRAHLIRHRCELIGREHLLDLHRTFTVPRLGRIDETVEL